MDKRIISLLLSVAVISVLLLVTLPANAEQSNVFLLEAESSTAGRGDTITYTLSLSNSKSITAFGFNIVLPDGLAFVENSALLNTGAFGDTLEIVPNNGYQVLWYSEDGNDFTEEDKVEILQFQCKVDDNAEIGTSYEVTLKNVLEAAGSSYNYDDISSEIMVAPHTLSISAIQSGFEVSGNITSYLKGEGDITVQLLSGETIAYYTVVNTYTEENASKKEYSSTYSIPKVADGTYTLRVSKANHVTRDYTVEVSGGTVGQDVQIHLLGDINGDGKIRSNDISFAYNHVNGSSPIMDDYILKCADIDGSGRVRSNDITRIYNHVNGSNPIW